MYQLFNGHLKYLFLVPIILMIGFVLFYQFALMKLQEGFLAAGLAPEDIPGQIDWLTTGFIIQTAVTFLVNITYVGLLCYLGNIYRSRNGPKWRSSQ